MFYNVSNSTACEVLGKHRKYLIKNYIQHIEIFLTWTAMAVGVSAPTSGNCKLDAKAATNS